MAGTIKKGQAVCVEFTDRPKEIIADKYAMVLLEEPAGLRPLEATRTREDKRRRYVTGTCASSFIFTPLLQQLSLKHLQAITLVLSEAQRCDRQIKRVRYCTQSEHSTRSITRDKKRFLKTQKVSCANYDSLFSIHFTERIAYDHLATYELRGRLLLASKLARSGTLEQLVSSVFNQMQARWGPKIIEFSYKYYI